MTRQNKDGLIESKTIMKGLRFAIFFSLLISALLILFTIDPEALREAVNSISNKIIFLLITAVLLNWLAAGLRLKILVSTIGSDLSLKDSIIIYLSGAFISNVTPFATGGGPFQIYFLHKKGVNIGKASMVVVTQFLLRIFFFGIATTVFIVFFNWAISPGVVPSYLFYLAFGLGFLFALVLIVFSLVPGFINWVIQRIFQIKKVTQFVKGSHKTKKLLVKARRELKEFHHSLEVLGKYRWRLILAWLCTFFYWATLFTIIPLVLKGLGQDPHYFRSYVMQTIIYLILPYMPTPGASGIAEIGFASIFVSFIPANLIGLVTFVWRFLSFYIVLLVGGFFALREISRKGNQN